MAPPTVKDLLDARGKHQFAMLRVETLEEAEAAEKAGVGGYSKTKVVSSFAAAFPMDAPRYVVVVVVDEPKGTLASSFQRTAAFTAAPVVGRLVPRIGPMLGVQPDENRDVDISDLRYLVDRGE